MWSNLIYRNLPVLVSQYTVFPLKYVGMDAGKSAYLLITKTRYSDCSEKDNSIYILVVTRKTEFATGMTPSKENLLS